MDLFLLFVTRNANLFELSYDELIKLLEQVFNSNYVEIEKSI